MSQGHQGTRDFVFSFVFFLFARFFRCYFLFFCVSRSRATRTLHADTRVPAEHTTNYWRRGVLLVRPSRANSTCPWLVPSQSLFSPSFFRKNRFLPMHVLMGYLVTRAKNILDFIRLCCFNFFFHLNVHSIVRVEILSFSFIHERSGPVIFLARASETWWGFSEKKSRSVLRNVKRNRVFYQKILSAAGRSLVSTKNEV